MPRKPRHVHAMSPASVSVALAMLLLWPSLVHATVEEEGEGEEVSGITWVHMTYNDSDLDLSASAAEQVISGEATVFTKSIASNLSACLCERGASDSGWCYMGQSVNGQSFPVNVSTMAPSGRANLRCTFYTVVGRTYLYCSSTVGVASGPGNHCHALDSCPSGIAALFCSQVDKQCLAWCEGVEDIDLHLHADDGETEQKAPPSITHHLGHDVIGVIAGGVAVCFLLLLCCLVDKIRYSKYCILYCTKKKKKKPEKKKTSSKAGQARKTMVAKTVTRSESAPYPLSSRMTSSPFDRPRRLSTDLVQMPISNLAQGEIKVYREGQAQVSTHPAGSPIGAAATYDNNTALDLNLRDEH